jgi:fructose-1-phosphate kinase PfkB-like protein
MARRFKDLYIICTLILAVNILLVSAFPLKMSFSDRSLIIGLNPALQRIITLPNLKLGEVNRGSSLQIGIGGKGQNVIVSSKCLGSSEPQAPELLQLLGKGLEGDMLLTMLEAQTDSIISIRTNARCRICYSLISGGQTTEVIEPTDNIESSEIEALLSALDSKYAAIKPKHIAVMGSMPKNCPSNLYSQILRKVNVPGSVVLLDTVIDIIGNIITCLTIGSQCIVKINVEELFTLAKKDFHENLSKDDIRACVADFANVVRGSLPSDAVDNYHMFMLLTNGPRPSHFFELSLSKAAVPSSAGKISDIFHSSIQAPPLSNPIVNPIGAGDATSAGIIYYISKHCAGYQHLERDHVLRAFCWGLSCGTASCFNKTNAVFDVNDVESIYSNLINIISSK